MDVEKVRAKIFERLHAAMEAGDGQRRAGLRRVKSVVGWTLDQHRWKGEISLARLEEIALAELEVYLRQLEREPWFDRSLPPHVAAGRDIVRQAFAELAGEGQPAEEARATKA